VIKVSMKFEKETKRTLKFTEVESVGEPIKLGTLYVQKFCFITKPKQISVTVDEE